MNYVCFSLFGDNPKYHVGAIANMWLVRRFYPEWRAVFYVGNTSLYTAEMLRVLGARVIWMGNDPQGLYWRFYILEELEEGERAIFRDADSRIFGRETMAVEEWIASGKTFHIMRDHPKHGMSVMIGMWGALGPVLRGIKAQLKAYPNQRCGVVPLFDAYYETIMKHDALEHGEFHLDRWPNQKPFPGWEGDRFVGEIFDEYNQPNLDWRARL